MKQQDAREVIRRLGMEYFRNLSSFGALQDATVEHLLTGGVLYEFPRSEYVSRYDERADQFEIVIRGKIAYYRRGENQDVLTRYFRAGEQMGFDQMLGMIPYNGTDVAVEDSLILVISIAQFRAFQRSHPEEFGIFMINLSRELSREIALLEDVIASGTGWEIAS